MTRRRAFTIAAQGLGGIAGAAIVLPAVGFAVAPIFHRGKERWEAVGPTSDFVEDTYRQVVFTETEGIGDAGKTTAYIRKSSKQLGRRTGQVRRGLQPLRPPRLPGPLRRGRRQLHLPLPRWRLRLPGQTDRRPAGAPARPVPDPHPQRPGRGRPALQRHLPARTGPRPRPRRVHRRDLGIPLPAAAVYLPSALMPKIPDSIVPAPLRKPAKPGEGGVAKGQAPADLKTSPPERQTHVQRLGDQAKEAPVDVARLGRPAHRRQRLPHRDALPQGAEGDQLVLHARLRHPLRLHRAGGHRRLPGDVLHAVGDPGLRLDRPHQQRRLRSASSCTGCTSGAPA